VKPNFLRAISLLVLASIALTAQVARQETVVPLKNWATPLYWQPNQTERQSSEGAKPQLQFSANQVSSNALTFIAITPCRLIDTRGAAANFNGISPFSGPSIAATTTATFPVQSATEASTDTTPAPCGTIPSIAQAYSVNLTVVPVAGGAVDYISMWPSGYSQPFVATLNDPQGAIVANAAIVPAGTVSGGISVYNQGPAAANVIIDMNGFFTAPTADSNNTAIGSGALFSNTTGFGNTATGAFALLANTTGGQNTAFGNSALFSNTTGDLNIGIGINAGRNAPASNGNSIYIGSGGTAGDASGTIAIGMVGTQTSTFIAGIYGGSPGTPNLQVCVDANGTLGTTGCSGTPSSRRFKEQITDMGDSSSKLLQLHPITFFYKPEYDDGSHALQYGLIAEDVAKVYPDMVGYDKDGQPSSVKYQSLAPMLLNEVQKQNAQLQKQNAQLQSEVQIREEQNRKLEDRLAVLEAALSTQAPTATQPSSSQ
jgi:Chaperone of endosialidase